MTDGRKTAGGYEVGYGKPPKEHRFTKDRQPFSRGRRKKARSGQTDVAALLNEPIPVRTGDVVREMSAFEIGLRKLVKAALQDRDLKAAFAFLKLCEDYAIIEPVPPPRSGGVLTVPRTWDCNEWMAMLERYGAPPWPGPRSGLPGDPPSADGAEVCSHAIRR
jgi:hypothetical protein